MKIPVKLRFSVSLRTALNPDDLPRKVTKVLGKILAHGPRTVRKYLKGKLRVEASVTSGFYRRPQSGFLRFGEEGVGYYVDHYQARALASALHRVTKGAELPDDLKQVLVNFAEELGQMHGDDRSGPPGTTVVSPFPEAYEGRTRPAESAPRIPSPSAVGVQSVQGRAYDSLTKTFSQPERDRWTYQT